MEQKDQAVGNADVEFHVLVRGLKIDAATHERINKAIRQAVMKEIATLDFEGDLKIGAEGSFEQARSLGVGNDRLALRTAGIAVQAMAK